MIKAHNVLLKLARRTLAGPVRRRMPPVVALVLLAAAPASGADAQTVVFDPTSYGKLIEEARTALKQLDQAKQLYDGFNTASGVNGLATSLSSPALRQVIPDASTFLDGGSLSRLGALGAEAQRLRGASRPYTPSPSDPQGQALDASGDRAARGEALGEAVADAGAQRLQGLQQLQDALTTAPTARAVMDLQARLSAEQAMTANDQMRLQGLALAQAAQARLQSQQARERAAAASAARLQAYKAGFR